MCAKSTAYKRMGILKRLDLFKSVNADHKDGTLIGTLFTFICVGFIVVFFAKEIKEYRAQKLATKLYVQEYEESVKVSFDISFLHINCTDVYSSLAKPQKDYKIDKKPIEGGCRVSSTFEIQPTDNTINFSYGQPKSPAELAYKGVMFKNKAPMNIDFSHEIHRFALGDSNTKVSYLSAKFPDMVQPNALEGVAYHSESIKDGHSLFLYELNVVTADIRGTKELIYNYNKNTVNMPGGSAYVNFKLKFSAIGVEYIEGNENIWEFLTYMLGIVGGILATVKFLVNVVSAATRKKDADNVMMG